MKMKYRHQVDLDDQLAMSRRSAISFAGHTSLTSQSEKDSADLNVLVRRFGVANLVRPADPAAFGVFDADLDLRSALQVVQDADAAFMTLPAKVRERFKNDPVELLAAIKDESRRDELEELGVLRPAARPDPAPPAPMSPEPARGKGGKGEGPSVQSPE